MKVLVIIPTYNEGHNIGPMIQTMLALHPYDLLFIDDNSPDGTSQIIKQNQSSRISLIERPQKLGLGNAYKEGFRWALQRNYDAVVEMDCDFSHSPQELPKLIEKLEQCDLVIGSRYLNGMRIVNWPLWRLALSSFAARYVRFFLALPLSDPTSGFKAIRREALEKLAIEKIMSDGYAFQFEVNYRLWRQGIKILEVPITFYERLENQSKMGVRIIIEACFAVFRLRFKAFTHSL